MCQFTSPNFFYINPDDKEQKNAFKKIFTTTESDTAGLGTDNFSSYDFGKKFDSTRWRK